MKRRHLSAQELALWEEVTKKTVSLHPKKRNMPPPEVKPSENSKPIRAINITVPTVTAPKPSPESQKWQDSYFHAPKTDTQIWMDRKQFKRMKQGKLSPDQRIDLHGMTLQQAYPVLVRFILSSHEKGCRLVLVITGKGKSGDDSGPIPTPRGVLKHQVPQWLRSVPLKNVVLQVSPAHVSHGGGGAYYVYLRRKTTR